MIRLIVTAFALLALPGCSHMPADSWAGEDLLGASSASAFSDCAESIERRSPTSGVWTYSQVQFEETAPSEWTVRGVVAHGVAETPAEPFECVVDESATQSG